MLKHIEFIVNNVRKDVQAANTKKNIAFKENWSKIVDGRIGRRTQVIGLRQKILYVKVESQALLAELANFKKDSILEKAQEKYPEINIRDIKFIV